MLLYEIDKKEGKHKIACMGGILGFPQGEYHSKAMEHILINIMVDYSSTLQYYFSTINVSLCSYILYTVPGWRRIGENRITLQFANCIIV